MTARAGSVTQHTNQITGATTLTLHDADGESRVEASVGKDGKIGWASFGPRGVELLRSARAYIERREREVLDGVPTATAPLGIRGACS